MKTNRMISLVLTILFVCCAMFAGCTAKEEKTKVKVTALKGPTGMSVSYLMDGKGEGSYEITLASAPDEIVAAVSSGSADIAAVPINLAASLYNKLDKSVVVLGVNTLGVLYVLESGDTVNALSDLSGKTLYATGQGSTPEYLLSYLLEKNNVEDVTVEYKTEHSELATLMGAGEVTLGMLPEPHVTAVMLKNESLRVALDLTEEWNKTFDVELAQGVVIANREFVENNAGAIELFMKDMTKSTEFINSDSDEAAQSIETNGIMASAAAAKKAIPNCNIVWITGAEMKDIVSNMFTALHTMNPASIGKNLPGDDIYYVK